MRDRHRFTKWILVGLALLVLVGCTKSVRKVSTASVDEAYLSGISGGQTASSQLADKTPEALVNSGWIYLLNNNFELAKMHFVVALKKNPEFAMAYVGLAKIEQEIGNYPAAAMNYHNATELQPGLLPALIGQSQVLRLQGKYNKAIEAINRAMMVAPDDVRVLNELAIIYDLTGKENLAEPLYREILDKAPDQASSYNNLGMNFMMKGQYDEAVLQFYQAASIDRKNTKIRNNLATAYMLSGDTESSLQIFKETLGEAEAYNNIGYLFMTQGKYDEAEKYLTLALKTNPRFYERAQDNLERVQSLKKQRDSL